jgi:hypothetical protein
MGSITQADGSLVKYFLPKDERTTQNSPRASPYSVPAIFFFKVSMSVANSFRLSCNQTWK